jgi:hypothetical protein
MKFSQLKKTKKSENNLGLETNGTDLDLSHPAQVLKRE